MIGMSWIDAIPTVMPGLRAIAGKHDRPWFDRSVFGKIRYMSQNSTAKRFDSGRYIDLVGEQAETGKVWGAAQKAIEKASASLRHAVEPLRYTSPSVCRDPCATTDLARARRPSVLRF